MNYAEMQAAFLQPPPEGRPAPPVPDTPGRRLRDAAEPIATITFWGKSAYDRFEELGLNFLTGYVWARAAPMGEPTAPVVVATFGVFEPGLVTGLYDQARAACSRDDVLAARERGAVESLHAAFPEAPDVSAAVQSLRRAVDVARGDVAGRPLFAGLTSLDWPVDPLGQLWHATVLLREYRGDVHQAANVAAGLDPVQMNLLTEYWLGWAPTAYAGTRGWSPEAMRAADDRLRERGLVDGDRLTDAGRRLREDIEARTEAAMEPLLAAIGDDLPELTDHLEQWSAQIVAGGHAPPDPYKRVSG